MAIVKDLILVCVHQAGRGTTAPKVSYMIVMNKYNHIQYSLLKRSASLYDTATCIYPCANGICENPNECKCAKGWSGYLCDRRKWEVCTCTYMLESLKSCCNYAAVCDPSCGRHGNCVRPDECACHNGWEGDVCDKGKQHHSALL